MTMTTRSRGGFTLSASARKRAWASPSDRIRPVGNELGLRCLLGAQALSRPNPRPAGSAQRAHFRTAPGIYERLAAFAPHRDAAQIATSQPFRLASPVLD